ncbi:MULTISPECIES: hypothetical protein [Vibrio]|uniref:Uncharacterized protein n=2 Tax=Vibrio TaxID=662 RepID=A0A5P9CL68_9VIBR|nr:MULTISPECIES: hypothetical protein [Vibrio]MYM59921.1 hypothetical protein [Vibrio tetraodonis subsp. pristinus]QFT26741.1 hypothetical protein FIV01_09905 [Vibrio aquimaris]
MAKSVQPPGWRGALWAHQPHKRFACEPHIVADNTQHERVLSRATILTNSQNVLRHMLHFGKIAATQYLAQ